MSEDHFDFLLIQNKQRNQRWVADDVSDGGQRWLVKLNTGLRPQLSHLVSVFGLGERLIQKVKWPNAGAASLAVPHTAGCLFITCAKQSTQQWSVLCYTYSGLYIYAYQKMSLIFLLLFHSLHCMGLLYLTGWSTELK